MKQIDPTIGVAALGALETALNAALALDTQTLQRLGKLEGKVIEIRLIQPAITLHLAPHPEGLRLMGWFEGTPDCSLAGSASAFLRLRSEGPHGDLSVEGDAELAAEFQHIISELDFDIEEHISHIAGDVVAHEAGRVARSAAAFVQETAAGLRQGATPADVASGARRAADGLKAGVAQLAQEFNKKVRG